MIPHDPEWLEADGCGGFAMGTVSGIRTRRYHSTLLAATKPPGGRMVLVNGHDVQLEIGSESFPLSSQCYLPGVIAPDHGPYRAGFRRWPWPTWTFTLPNGLRIVHSLFVVRGHAATVLRWRLLDPAGAGPVRLRVRPFLSGRDYHLLQHENPLFHMTPEANDAGWTWTSYPDVPAVHALTNGRYLHAPQWYRQFLYPAEHDRGLDDTEDLAAPGEFLWDLTARDATLIWTTEATTMLGVERDPERLSDVLTGREATRRAARTPHQLATEQFLVHRDGGATIIAGYPWFTDWGRDTFIALRGLCLAQGEWEIAAEVLGAWAATVDRGMVPNRFPDGNGAPEYNAVDASLWFAFVAQEFLQAVQKPAPNLYSKWVGPLQRAVRAIITGYSSGTRFGIHRDQDGLIAAGVPGVQLTWMDAKAGDWVVTPRIGKPVEIQALWLNVLAMAQAWWPAVQPSLAQGTASFQSRFWLPELGRLADVVDVDHQFGNISAALRPNQLFAIGGLPYVPVSREIAAAALTQVTERLLTPMGLRTLDPADANYQGRYHGGVLERDGAYHQGTVWPWLIGPYVDAWLHVHGRHHGQRAYARETFLRPLSEYRATIGLGQLPEVADGNPPQTPGGCPCQAWSLSEYLRLDQAVLAGE